MSNSLVTAACIEKSMVETVINYAASTGPLIAIFAAVIAIWQIRSSARVVRRAAAYNIYQEYLKLAIQHPILAYGNELAIKSDYETFSAYKWFIANMLLSFEEILCTCGKEADWAVAIAAQLRRHAWHLSVSSSIIAGQWKIELKELIDAEIFLHEARLLALRDAPPK